MPKAASEASTCVARKRSTTIKKPKIAKRQVQTTPTKSQNKTSFKFELCHISRFCSSNIIPYKYARIREKIIKNILPVRILKIGTSDFLSLDYSM